MYNPDDAYHLANEILDTNGFKGSDGSFKDILLLAEGRKYKKPGKNLLDDHSINAPAISIKKIASFAAALQEVAETGKCNKAQRAALADFRGIMKGFIDEARAKMERGDISKINLEEIIRAEEIQNTEDDEPAPRKLNPKHQAINDQIKQLIEKLDSAEGDTPITPHSSRVTSLKPHKTKTVDAIEEAKELTGSKFIAMDAKGDIIIYEQQILPKLEELCKALAIIPNHSAMRP